MDPIYVFVIPLLIVIAGTLVQIASRMGKTPEQIEEQKEKAEDMLLADLSSLQL